MTCCSGRIKTAGIAAVFLLVLALQSARADSVAVQDCTDSCDSLISLADPSISLGNGWELSADRMGWCRKKNDPKVDNIVLARGNIQIRKEGELHILSVDYSDMKVTELKDVAVTIERDSENKVLAVAPSYSGLGMQLQASNIIRYKGSGKRSAITLVSDFPWRFYPNKSASNLVLYPGFFRPVLTGLSDGTFGWTGNIVDALENKFVEGSLNIPVPLTVTQNSVSTVEGHEPVLLINVGSWFGKTLGLPLEEVPVVMSQEAGESHAKAKFDATDIFGSLGGKFLSVFTHIGSINNVFHKFNSSDKLKLETKKAIVWGDKKIVKYSSSKLSPLFGEQRNKFLDDIEAAKSNKTEGLDDFFKVLGRFFAMLSNSEVDYDFINGDFALNPLFVQVGLFEAMGDFEGNIYAGFSKRGDPAWYFLDMIGLDITVPHGFTTETAIPFFGLEKIILVENPFQVGLGIVELGGKISGMADPLYTVFHLAGKGGESIDYSKWDLDVGMEGSVALVDSLMLIDSLKDIPLMPWPLLLKSTMDFKLGNQNGIAGTGTISLFDVVDGTGSAHFFIGKNDKPVDFQAGLSGSMLGAKLDGVLSSYFGSDKSFNMKMHTKAAYRLFGHELAGLPLDIHLLLDEKKVTLSGGFHWDSQGCIASHCLIHKGEKTFSHEFRFDQMALAEMDNEFEISYGDRVYYSAGSAAGPLSGDLPDHLVEVGGNTELLNISVQGTSGGAPQFIVNGPDGEVYDMAGDAVVIDVSAPDFEVLPVAETGGHTILEHGFIIDPASGTTLFVLKNPLAGQYTVAPESGFDGQLSAYVVPEMVSVNAMGANTQNLFIDSGFDETIEVAFHTNNTGPSSVVGVYARPVTFRNTLYHNWHERYFNEIADPLDRTHLSYQGSHIYNEPGNYDNGGALGSLEAAGYAFNSVVTPKTDVVWINQPLTHREATTRQRNHASIKLGEFVIERDGTHYRDLRVGAHTLYPGRYQLLIKYENRKDARFVELSDTLIVNSGMHSMPSAVIESVQETESGEAHIQWYSHAELPDTAMVRVFLHDHARGDCDEVYLAHFDVPADKPVRIPGLERGYDYSFSIAVLGEVSEADHTGRTHTLFVPGMRSEIVPFTPWGSAFTGSPCVKVVNYESYARFDRSGDLSIRLRVLNESETPMTEGLVRIYYHNRKPENLLASFHADLDGLSYFDVHADISFERIAALKNASTESPVIVYDIDTKEQNEHVTHDNAGIVEIENPAVFLSAYKALHEKPLRLDLKQGWNLVGDAVWETDIFWEFPHAAIYSHDGAEMLEDVRNSGRGGAYFVYLPGDMNLVLAGTPIIPDFNALDDGKWHLLGTGVDLHKVLPVSPDSSEEHTYTPGEVCDRIFVLEPGNDGAIQWVKNPEIIEAGSGFWCIREER